MKKRKGIKALTALLTIVMLVGVLGFGNVFAAESLNISSIKVEDDDDSFDYETEQNTTDSYPETYDLRNVDGVSYVTSVKFQNPWGTCWAFAYTAAAEISILGETGGLEGNPDLDLSEHHLAWFTKNHIDNEENCQNGEGLYVTESAGTSSMDGGQNSYATIPYASGMGVVSESANSLFEYHGTAGKVVSTDHNTFDSEAACIAAGETPYYYSGEDDWSIDEALRFYQTYKLEETYILPAANPVKGSDGTYTANADGINAIKDMLMNKRGVAIAYCSDNSRPGQTADLSNSRFVNTNWAHFTWSDDSSTAYANHEVCIVGWDDNYAASNFTITNPVKWDEYQNAVYKLDTSLVIYKATDGTYYYKNSDDDPVTINSCLYDDEDDNYIVPSTTTGAYQFKDNVELDNDNHGNPYYPDSSNYIDTYLCTIQHETGTYTPEGDGAWIVKNSWGSLYNADGSETTFPTRVSGGVDDTGYFYISYYDRSISTPEAFDFITSEDDSDYDYSYVQQYDYLPTTNVADAGAGFIGSGTKVSMANAFASDVALDLTAVSCVTSKPNSTVTYEVYLQGSESEDDPAATVTATYEYGGYHRAELPETIRVEAEQTYVVVVTESYEASLEDGTTVTAYAAPMSWGLGSGDNANSYVTGVVNKGESYLIVGDASDENSWVDLYDLLDSFTVNFKSLNLAKDPQFDNFNIKAYSTPVDEETPDVPKTGDSNSLLLMLGIMLAAAAAATVALKVRRKYQ